MCEYISTMDRAESLWHVHTGRCSFLSLSPHVSCLCFGRRRIVRTPLALSAVSVHARSGAMQTTVITERCDAARDRLARSRVRGTRGMQNENGLRIAINCRSSLTPHCGDVKIARAAKTGARARARWLNLCTHRLGSALGSHERAGLVRGGRPN